MTAVIREGDATTTGGKVLQASGTLAWEDRRLARMGDPVWCAACSSVGFIAQGNPTFIDDVLAVATQGLVVRCKCPDGVHRLIASQDRLKADMQAAIGIPKDQARKARKQAKKIAATLNDTAQLP